jgi:hypothetical protein
MPRKRNGCAIALFAGLIALSGGVHAQAAPAERSLPLPSGATLKVASDWTVTEVKDGLTLEDPEKQLKIEVVEVDASAGLSASISAAWVSRRPGFSRQEFSSSDSPGREGWDLYRWAEYKTSPEESRAVSAYACKKDSRAVVLLADGKPEVEEEFLSAVRETQTYLMDMQKDWKVPPDPAEVKRLAGAYRNAALGELVVHPGEGEVVFQFGGWKSRMATKLNPDGTTSFMSIDPGARGFEFNAPAAKATYTRLTLRDPQHTYEYEAAPPAK